MLGRLGNCGMLATAVTGPAGGSVFAHPDGWKGRLLSGEVWCRVAHVDVGLSRKPADAGDMP
jgi:hypothetical protein